MTGMQGNSPTHAPGCLRAAWQGVRRPAALATLVATSIAAMWLWGWHRHDVTRGSFAGLLVAGGFAVGAVVSAFVVAPRLAAGNHLPASTSPRTALAEVFVLAICMVMLPVAGLAIGQVAAAALGTTWVQPFTWWDCCDGHGDAARLLAVGIWWWLLIPWAYWLVAAGAGGPRIAAALLLLVGILVDELRQPLPMEILLREWRLPVAYLAIPGIGLIAALATRAGSACGPWQRAGVSASVPVVAIAAWYGTAL
jgi:hypothetical protein